MNKLSPNLVPIFNGPPQVQFHCLLLQPTYNPLLLWLLQEKPCSLVSTLLPILVQFTDTSQSPSVIITFLQVTTPQKTIEKNTNRFKLVNLGIKKTKQLTLYQAAPKKEAAAPSAGMYSFTWIVSNLGCTENFPSLCISFIWVLISGLTLH